MAKRKRTAPLLIAFTPAERQTLQKAAKVFRETESAYIRGAALAIAYATLDNNEFQMRQALDHFLERVTVSKTRKQAEQSEVIGEEERGMRSRLGRRFGWVLGAAWDR